MKNFLIISLFFLIVGCPKLIDEPSLIEKNGVMYLPQSDKPYSGDVSKLDNFGKTLLKGTYKNGKKDGLWTQWYVNGQKDFEDLWKDGNLDGLSTFWYEDGQKMGEGTYKNGNRVGLYTQWFENGQKEYEETYKGGKEDRLWTWWYENGKKLKEETYKDGELISKKELNEVGSVIE